MEINKEKRIPQTNAIEIDEFNTRYYDLAGLLYDRLHTYEIAFVAAGVAPVVGAIMMCLIPRVKQVGLFKVDGIIVIHFKPSSKPDYPTI